MNLKLFLLALALAMVLFLQAKIRPSNLVMKNPTSKSATPNGKALYTSKCIKCHNANPTKPGSVGPDIADASLELITVRTQKRGYPTGYTPKRKTKIMPIIKLTEAELKALHSYINSFNKKK